MDCILETVGEVAIDFLENLKIRRPSVMYIGMSENLQNVAVLPRAVRNDLHYDLQKTNEDQSRKIYIRKYSVLPAFPKLYVDRLRIQNFTMNAVLI